VAAFLSSARDGEFQTSTPIHKEYSTLSLIPSGRPDNWKELAKEREIVAITCYHLGGDENVKWTLDYNAGLRGDLVDQTASINACGRDMYVQSEEPVRAQNLTCSSIVCNSWLARPLPKPDTEVDMIMVLYGWAGFDWNQ
jgi:hypothetical protein